MHNLGQTRSRQFHRHSTIEPIVRTTSFHTLEDSRKNGRNKNFMRTPYAENNYDLANIVNQLMEKKPKTAFQMLNKQSSRSHKTEINSEAKQTHQFFTNKRQQRQNQGDRVSEQNEETKSREKHKSADKKQYKLLQIDSQFKEKEFQPNQSSRQNRREISDFKLNVETANFPEGITNKKDQLIKQQISIYKLRDDATGIQEASEYTLAAAKKRSQHAFVPTKTRLTVKTIDSLVDIRPKDKVKHNRAKRYYLEAIKPDEDNHHNHTASKEKDSNLIKERKSKKSATDIKIPEFIKVSLETYSHEPEFKLKEITSLKKIIQQTQKNEETVEKPQQDEELDDKSNNKSHDNLAGAKLKLEIKEKRKSIRISEYIKQKREQIATAPIEQLQPEKSRRASRKSLKNRRIYLQDDKQDICGWEDGDSHLPEALFLKE